MKYFRNPHFCNGLVVGLYIAFAVLVLAANLTESTHLARAFMLVLVCVSTILATLWRVWLYFSFQEAWLRTMPPPNNPSEKELH